MEEDELEELRKKRLAERQKGLEAKSMEKQLKDTLRASLTESAYDRLSNVAIANKELYLTTAQQVLLASQRMNRRINEAELLTILRAIKGKTEKESSITFHKK